MIKLFLKLHKLHKEFRNPDKKICFILDYLSDFFKTVDVKSPIIMGGFSRDLIIRGSWDKVEHEVMNGKDIDIEVDYRDFLMLKNKVKNFEDAIVVFENDDSIRIDLNVRGLPYKIKTDIFCPKNAVDILSSSIHIDIHKKRFIEYKNIYDLVFKKRERFLYPENRRKQVGFVFLRILFVAKKCKLQLDDELIRQMKELDSLIAVKDLAPLLNDHKCNAYSYLDSNPGMIQKYRKICELYDLKNHLRILESLLDNADVNYKKEETLLDMTDWEQRWFSMNIRKIPNVDSVNFCHNSNFASSVFFYVTTRTNGIDLFLETGFHDGSGWIKVDRLIDEENESDFCINNEKEIILHFGGKIIFQSPKIPYDNFYVLNYDCKQQGR